MVYTIWMNAWAHVVQLRFLQTCVLPIIDYFVSRICIHRDFIIYLEISFTSHFFSSTSGKIEKIPPSFLEHSYFNLSLQEEFTSFWTHKIFCFKFEISFKISSRFDWLTAGVTGVCKIATNHTDRNHSSTQQGKSRGQQWWFWQEGLSWSSLLIFCSENWAGLEEDTVQGGTRIIFLAGKRASNPLKKIIFIIIAWICVFCSIFTSDMLILTTPFLVESFRSNIALKRTEMMIDRTK